MEKALVTKLEKYCAYQERCHFEVRNKAFEIGLYGDDVDLALLHLIQANFLNEERFVELYIRSKINQKRWGPIKIEIALKQKRIEPKLIKKFINKVDEKLWVKNLSYLAERFIQTKNINLTIFKQKTQVQKYLYSKGYRFETIEFAIKKWLST